jgi:UDP-N-acetylmuramate--alanine ligase
MLANQEKKFHHIHFVGIGGAGMSGLAEVVYSQGYKVSGSDLTETSVTHRLRALGITVHIGHCPEHVDHVDLVVMTSAVKTSNPEIIAARANKIPVLKRAQMLAELMRLKRGIAIAGTSGKTTTTSLLASIMHAAKLDPTFIIGGKVNSVEANAKLGLGEFLLAEADESDASFLYLNPEIAVITNINPDHLYNYEQRFDLLKQAFFDFLQQLPSEGLAVLCADDPNVAELLEKTNCPMKSYGFSAGVDFQATELQLSPSAMTFVLKRKNKNDLPVMLSMLGKHNVSNALAAIAVADYLGVEDEVICEGLAEFVGVERRFNVLGEKLIADKQVLLIDDYGHHPKEILATVETLREAWPERNVTMVFQPHRYTRTRDLFKELVVALSTVDRLILLPIYPACEPPIESISSENLLAAIGRGKMSSAENLFPTLEKTIHDGDILLMQGAGDIGLLAKQLAGQPSLAYIEADAVTAAQAVANVTALAAQKET